MNGVYIPNYQNEKRSENMIHINIPTEQGYLQTILIHSEEDFLDFKQLLEKCGKKIISESIMKVDKDYLTLYKSENFNESNFSGSSYEMNRQDALNAVNIMSQ